MGCDIHMHIELKVRGSEEWYHYAAPSVRSNYLFFAILGPCGRRKEIQPIAPARGLPSDASLITRLCYEDEQDDAHGVSWLGADEIDEIRTRYQAAVESEGMVYDHLKNDLEHGVFHTYLLGNALTTLEGTPFSDVRLVFWFDN